MMLPTMTPESISPERDTDDARLERARAAFPAVASHRCLNTGSFGLVSTVYAAALARITAEEVAASRTAPGRHERLAAARAALRAELADVVGAAPGEIALTQRTAAGLEAVIDLWPWQPGDEVVCTDLEHEALRVPLERAARRFGFTLRVAAVPRTDDANLDWLACTVTPRTRLIAFSAVAFETGAALPVGPIAELARAAGAATLVDAAQAAGAKPLELAAAGVDFCALPLQKWLCGPEGLGALYLRASSAASLREPPGDRVAQGLGVLEAAAALLRWQRESLGREWIYARTAALAGHARRVLAAVPGARTLTPSAHAGLITIGFEFDTGPLAAALAARGFLVRHLPALRAFRVASTFFNTEREIDALAAALSEIP
jgi:L-cysteine/cystine lyase